MHLNFNSYSPNFLGIKLTSGGIDYVRNEGGESAVGLLNKAIDTYADSKWRLNIGKEGYSLTSPTTLKTYKGPFTVKKHSKTGAKREETSEIIIRMDESNRVKYPVKLKSMLDVRKIYKKIKTSDGIKQMLLLLSLLEGHQIMK